MSSLLIAWITRASCSISHRCLSASQTTWICIAHRREAPAQCATIQTIHLSHSVSAHCNDVSIFTHRGRHRKNIGGQVVVFWPYKGGLGLCPNYWWFMAPWLPYCAPRFSASNRSRKFTSIITVHLCRASAMHVRELAMSGMSVCPSVCLSVTRLYLVKTNKLFGHDIV